MSKDLKFILTTFLIGIIQAASADTKVLHSLNIPVEDSYRFETISLDNDQHLVVEGLFVQNFEIPNDPLNRLTLVVNYVTDKNGHRAKYVLVKKEFQRPQHLNPSTLKSSTG